MDISHTFAGDLDMILTHKDTGTSVNVSDSAGGSADFIGQYWWEPPPR